MHCHVINCRFNRGLKCEKVKLQPQEGVIQVACSCKDFASHDQFMN